MAQYANGIDGDVVVEKPDEDELPTLQKVAILMVALGQDASGQVMKFLSDFEIEDHRGAEERHAPGHGVPSRKSLAFSGADPSRLAALRSLAVCLRYDSIARLASRAPRHPNSTSYFRDGTLAHEHDLA